ncbi:DoxX family protein [Pedobacter panaciterrae]|uniref:DoxX family protein n=1 Tax=Pedobacter panaciterrae TaxID=363849 RepID=UPI00155DD467|nr:DoxX family protein [Pedobacter panaciterrae]NQX57133.1 DoxX family protein [Pedobacter panaciterrae]
MSKITTNTNNESREWKPWEKNLFRFFFIFLVIQIIPIDWKFYKELFSINWLHLHFHDLFKLTKYQPQFFSDNQIAEWGIGGFANWVVFIVIAAVGAVIWGKADAQRKEYTKLYYWLRVLVRYRLAFVLVTYGFIKFFPLQMPYPSLSNLLTNYGDYFAWKIYFQTVGIAPKYESFLGFVEILAAFLLFNRKTVTFGVGLIFGFLGNVAVANGFYDIGEQALSTFIVLLATFLFVYDIPRLYDLLIKETPAYANKFIPKFTDSRLRNARKGLKIAFLAFVVLFAYKAYDNYTNDPYKIPHTPGLSKAFGYYNVKEFVLNKDTIPYSKTDPNRWQDVVFEKWSTLTIKVNRPVKIDLSSGEEVHEKDIDRNYELAGYAGRHYFYYDADTVNHTLSLQNKNKNQRNEKLQLKYERPNDSTIVLSGINENRDSIHVVLAKINKKYMMFEGRRKPVKI